MSIVAKRLDGSRFKMLLGMKVGLGPCHIVLDRDPALPSKGAEPPFFSAMCIVAMVAHLGFYGALVPLVTLFFHFTVLWPWATSLTEIGHSEQPCQVCSVAVSLQVIICTHSRPSAQPGHVCMLCRLQGAERQFNGMIDVYVKTIKSDGFVGLYRGFVISCVGIIVYRGCYFGFYDTLKPLLLGEKAGLFVSFMLGYGNRAAYLLLCDGDTMLPWYMLWDSVRLSIC